MVKKITVSDIIDLVKEIDSEDPIDWGMLTVDEKTAIELIANNILDQYNTIWRHMPESEQTVIMLATITKLIVENFVLNLKLRQ